MRPFHPLMEPFYPVSPHRGVEFESGLRCLWWREQLFYNDVQVCLSVCLSVCL